MGILQFAKKEERQGERTKTRYFSINEIKTIEDVKTFLEEMERLIEPKKAKIVHDKWTKWDYIFYKDSKGKFNVGFSQDAKCPYAPILELKDSRLYEELLNIRYLLKTEVLG